MRGTRYVVKFGACDKETTYPYKTMNGAKRKARSLLMAKPKHNRKVLNRARIFLRVDFSEKLVQEITMVQMQKAGVA